tara:strand:+ start:958 stop:1419 length:462 start_codon:yes stop_codon:yes gene_type:complete
MSKLSNFVLILLFLSVCSSYAELVKPNKIIKPMEVIEIQLNGLKNNDSLKDNGIEQTWEFAHPNNKIFTGPLDRFKDMIKGESYKMLLNHLDHEIKEVFLEDKKAVYEVIIIDSDKRYFKFKWQVEKYMGDGPLKNCWLTTVVSQPTAIIDTA